jgi:hypothetical protein
MCAEATFAVVEAFAFGRGETSCPFCLGPPWPQPWLRARTSPPSASRRAAATARSCTDAYTNRGRLYADCRDIRGQIRGTSIELARCGDEEINNDNGLLVCGRFRGDYEDAGPAIRGGPGNGGGNGGGWGGGNGGGNGAGPRSPSMKTRTSAAPRANSPARTATWAAPRSTTGSVRCASRAAGKSAPTPSSGAAAVSSKATSAI